MLASFPDNANALVVGAGGGIGAAMVMKLLGDPSIGTVHAWSRRDIDLDHGKLKKAMVDLVEEETIARAASSISRLNLVIVASGLLHGPDGLRPEKSWRDLSAERLAQNFAINAIGPALVAKHTLPAFSRNERAVFAALSARVGSIQDNRLGGWYGYRASKAALNQIIKTLSIELSRSRRGAICVGLHPGTVDTGLSKPFQANVPSPQLFSP
ncbi:MAG: SDR family NAD(P)-dependent oxidoreductase, partial [Hyphomicrobiales bacterium]|nr:SDR family NAD(P)-dependent oxidoreductase [Hyphomicrobiales bacterium]